MYGQHSQHYMDQPAMVPIRLVMSRKVEYIFLLLKNWSQLLVFYRATAATKTMPEILLYLYCTLLRTRHACAAFTAAATDIVLTHAICCRCCISSVKTSNVYKTFTSSNVLKKSAAVLFCLRFCLLLVFL